jgi:phage shock protein A
MTDMLTRLREEIAKADAQGGDIGHELLAFWMADHAKELLEKLERHSVEVDLLNLIVEAGKVKEQQLENQIAELERQKAQS